MATGLIYRTPGQYLAAAKRLPDGPARQNMLRQAALAYATANAARNGNLRGAASGIGALRGLASTRIEAPFQQIINTFLDPASRSAWRDLRNSTAFGAGVALVNAASTVISVAARNPSIGNTINWVMYALGFNADPPRVVPQVQELRDFCNWYNGADGAVMRVTFTVAGGAAVAASATLAFSTDPGAQQATQAAQIVGSVLSSLDALVSQICTLAPAPSAPPPSALPPPPPPPILFPTLSPERAFQLLPPGTREALRPKKETGTSPLLWLGGAAAIGAVIYLMR